MPQKWITRQTALYRGDCMDVLRTIATGSIDAVIVDPPYGIAWQSPWREKRFRPLLNDDQPFIWFLHDAFRVCRESGALLCFCIARTQEVFRSAIVTAGFKVRSQVIWDRVAHGVGDCGRAFAPQHDVMWFATRKGFTFPGRRPKSVLRHQKVSGAGLVHPTEKPVALMTELIETITAPGGRVLDPCMGSGTTSVAALRCGRRFTGIEQDRQYYNIAVNRIRQALKDVGQGR